MMKSDDMVEREKEIDAMSIEQPAPPAPIVGDLIKVCLIIVAGVMGTWGFLRIVHMFSQ